MLSLEEAHARLLAAAAPLPGIELPLADAAGLVLAQDVAGLRTQPPFDASAMDGYAIRFNDLPGPWRVVGESAAGARFVGTVDCGEAVRIFTGAPLPAGTDTVLVQEDARREGTDLRLAGSGPDEAGRHVRPAGLDFGEGEPLLRRGARLTAAKLALAAAGGHAVLRVHPRPRVALLSTGNELVAPGAVPGPDQIIDSNGVMLRALVGGVGGDAVDLGIIRDDIDAVMVAIESARGADVLVTIGGASVGDHDLVAPALARCGAALDFWKVAIRPGKPVLIGRLGDTHVVGLPGNPVSAFVCAQLFLLPLLRRLRGEKHALPMPAPARAAVPFAANGVRRDFMRATFAWRNGERWVTPARTQDSSMLAVLAGADALLVRAPNAGPVAAGEQVEIITLDNTEADS